uniref:Nuclear protein 1 n=1 Tax=Ornithorhynchus anatinus TaxID=9258 RepID=A0A6I8PSJ8_ORNAN
SWTFPPARLLPGPKPFPEPPGFSLLRSVSFSSAFSGGGARKGRSKKEAAIHTNRPSPGGHERKLLTKLQNTEKKKQGAQT